MNVIRLLGGLALVTAIVVQPVFAQVERSGGGENSQLLEQYQQAVAARDQLQQDNAKLSKDLDDTKQQLQAAQRQLAASKAGASRNAAALTAAQTSNASTAKTLELYKSRMEELIARFQQTIDQLRSVETDRAQLKQQLAQNKTALDKCVQTNASLYQVTDQVLDRYEHQGMFSYLERSEPFTRIKRTQIENLALEYRQRAQALRVSEPGAASPAPAPPAGAARGQ